MERSGARQEKIGEGRGMMEREGEGGKEKDSD